MAKKPLDYYKKEITLQDLKPGDILIFKGDKSFASQKIMQLTDSMVSHSALYFQDDPIKALADSGEKGLHAHAIGTEKIRDKSTSAESRIQKPANSFPTALFIPFSMPPKATSTRIYATPTATCSHSPC